MSPGAPPHVHDPKVCKECKRELPISEFPPWQSSCGGHRHTCHDCSGAAHRRNVATQRELRVQRRAAWNDDLRRHGYRWRKTDAGWSLSNVLTGEVVTEDQAAATIQQRAEHESFEREMGRWTEPPF
jgi:hypothetical protein